ncbi:MAG: toxin-antitoxin system HicB family antitoxin [Clostridia bacterium]|nr:toxin-antitoxin system HicB family antitoxin [Clostridia bacterium]
MKRYEMKVIPSVDVDGKTYWTAFFPSIDGCIGGGDSAEEAISEAQENLEIYLEYLKEQKRPLPQEYEENKYSGKISLRISKSTHQKVSEIAEKEGISLNALLNNAIESYIGVKKLDIDLNKKIEQIRESSNNSYNLQQVNLQLNKEIVQTMWKHSIKVGE